MNKVNTGFSLQSHFEGKDPIVRKIYDQLIKSLKKCGPIIEDPKKTSIHLMHATALGGVATRNSYLILTIKSDHKMTSPRFHKIEQVSAKRFHHEVKLASPAEVDDELIGWLCEAYALSA